MNNNSFFVVGGAGDPEMGFVHGLASAAGWTWHQATCDGLPVHGGNAYRCDPVEIPAGATPVWVECSPVGGRPEGSVVIDHHNPEDPGYGVPPEKFLRGSSIGQFISLLAKKLGDVPGLESVCDSMNSGGSYPGEISRWNLRKCKEWFVDTYYSDGMPWFAIIPLDMVLSAAADHCLGAAYRGECPGVSFEALAAWRAETRADFQGRPVDEVTADVETAKAVLTKAVNMDGIPGCRDLRGAGFVPELPEAACQLGVAFTAELSDRSGRRKVVIQSADGKQLTAWKQWAAGLGLVDLYGGDPARGFAGGYYPA